MLTTSYRSNDPQPMDTTMGTSMIIKSKDVTRTSSTNSASNSQSCCCVRALHNLNAFIWKNQAALLKSDHLRAAPCITSNFLAVMRMIIAVLLVI